MSRVTEDLDWWRREVEEPCYMVLAKLSSTSDVVEGDAPVALRPEGNLVQNHRMDQGGRQPRMPRVPTGRERERTPTPRTSAGLRTGPDGLAQTNRSGREICRAYVSGSCTTTSCPRAHQCPKCLGDARSCPTPGDGCTRTPFNQGTYQPWKGKGKGKGKGRGKGK